MSEVAKKLRDRRLNVWNEARALADSAADENRAFSAEEQGKWDALNEELDNLDTRIKSVLDTEARSKQADDAFNALSGKPADGRAAATEGRTQELRALLRGDVGAPRFIELRPQLGQWTDTRALLSQPLTGTGGGQTVPTSFYNRLVAHLIEVSGVMQANPTVINTDSGEPLQIPKTTAHPSASAVTAQGIQVPSGDPTFSMVTLSSYKFGWTGRVARELVDDTGVDLEGYLSMSAGRAVGNLFGAKLVTGSGSGEPKGFLADATGAVTGATGTSGAPSYDNLVDLLYSVIAPYRASGSAHWLMQDHTVASIRKLKNTQGDPLWQPSMQLGSPDLILGKPVVTDPFMPTLATGAKSIAFGDFSTYFARMVGGIRFERSDEALFESDLIAYKCVMRGDGALIDTTGSIKYFQGG